MSESIPCTVSFNFQIGGLTRTGLASVSAAAATYLSAAKRAAIGADQARLAEPRHRRPQSSRARTAPIPRCGLTRPHRQPLSWL